MVGGDGNIYEGRGWDRVGAHTSDYNDVGLAWAFIGTHSTSLVRNKGPFDDISEFVICYVVRHGDVRSRGIQ